MIINIPTGEDFRVSGIAYLNLSWDSVLQLVLDLDYLDAYQWDDDGTVKDEYWLRAQRPLAVSVSLLQQATEFLLKSRIAEVSPYLLLDGSPRDWPRSCNQKDTSFAAFKTIDPQDLVRAHDTVVSPRLTAEFVTHCDRWRSVRNTIMHTVDRSLRFTAAEVASSIVEVAENLIGPRSWWEIRESFLEAGANSVLYSSDHVRGLLAFEALKIIDMFKPAQLKRYFGFNPRQRRYYCYDCQLESGDFDLDATTAQLDPNTSTSTTVYCFVCRKRFRVIRRKCTRSDCPGNVIAPDGMCLTCFKA